MSTAMLARSLARKVGYEYTDRAFIAGLLHDIGKIVLNHFMKIEFDRVLDNVNRENVPFMKAEQETLGLNHAMVGAKVAEHWNLPDYLVEAIALHHSPSEATVNPRLTSMVHVADAMGMSMGIGLGGDGMLYPFDGFAVEQLDLTEQMVEDSMSELADVMVDTETIPSE